MAIYQIHKGFAEFPDSKLSDFGKTVSTKLENNPSYPTPIRCRTWRRDRSGEGETKSPSPWPSPHRMGRGGEL